MACAKLYSTGGDGDTVAHGETHRIPLPLRWLAVAVNGRFLVLAPTDLLEHLQHVADARRVAGQFDNFLFALQTDQTGSAQDILGSREPAETTIPSASKRPLLLLFFFFFYNVNFYWHSIPADKIPSLSVQFYILSIRLACLLYVD